jgi:phosphopantetheine adenylyltransferase
MPECVKSAASKLAAKIAITKETTNIIQEVNIKRAKKGVPPMSYYW